MGDGIIHRAVIPGVRRHVLIVGGGGGGQLLIEAQVVAQLILRIVGGGVVSHRHHIDDRLGLCAGGAEPGQVAGAAAGGAVLNGGGSPAQQVIGGDGIGPSGGQVGGDAAAGGGEGAGGGEYVPHRGVLAGEQLIGPVPVQVGEVVHRQSHLLCVGGHMELNVLGDPVHRRRKIQSLCILKCPCAVPLIEGQLEGLLRNVRLLGGDQHLRKAAGGEGIGGGGRQCQSQGQRQGRGGGKTAVPLVQQHIVAPPEGKISPGAQRKGSGGACGRCRTKKSYHRFWNVLYYTEENGEMQEIQLELLGGNLLEDCKQ